MYKRKIALIGGMVTTLFIGFFTGRAKAAIPENYINLGSVVDWNTDGEEIYIMLSDGTEIYAYKTENIYDDNKNHIGTVAEIIDFVATETGLQLYYADGTGHYIEKGATN